MASIPIPVKNPREAWRDYKQAPENLRFWFLYWYLFSLERQRIYANRDDAI